MNKSLLLSLILMALSLCGCTHNNGDIGTLFGEWTMTDLKVDGVTDTQVLESSYVWAFQSHIICIKKMLPHNEYDFYWGTWEREEDKLVINYTHGTKPDTTSAPEEIYMTDSKMPMKIVSETQKILILSYKDPQGRNIMYSLRKQW